MQQQAGFSLFELMIVIAIIAILASITVPAYQGYVQKAAMTDMLQAMTPYKTAIELCALEQGSLADCNNGNHDIPSSKTTNYVTSININAGIMTLTGKNSLNGLTAILTPTINPTDSDITWARSCTTTPTNASLESACQRVFRF